MRDLNFKSKFRGKIYTINLKLRTRLTIISDLSGTGKTLVRKLAMKDCTDVIGFGTSDLKNLRALLNTEARQFNFKGQVVVVVVDNAEYLLRTVPELQDCINYYLVFIRQTSINIAASPNSAAKLKFNKETNTFYIEYVYGDGVWA